MKVHELKTDSEVYHQVRIGEKKFEIRKNDRGFKLYDQLLLRETKHTGEEMKSCDLPLIYTGEELKVQVSHIMHGPVYGLVNGWVIMSIEKVY